MRSGSDESNRDKITHRTRKVQIGKPLPKLILIKMTKCLTKGRRPETTSSQIRLCDDDKVSSKVEEQSICSDLNSKRSDSDIDLSGATHKKYGHNFSVVRVNIWKWSAFAFSAQL